MKTAVLKVTGIKVWTSPHIDRLVLHKGDVVRLPFDTAKKIAGLFIQKDEEQRTYYFTQANGEKVTHDLTTDEYVTAKESGADPIALFSIASGGVARPVEATALGVQKDTEVQLESEQGDDDEGGDVKADSDTDEDADSEVPVKPVRSASTQRNARKSK